MIYDKFHKQIATEGVRGGHKVFSILGLRWFSIDVEISPSLGGGGSFQTKYTPKYIKVTVRFKDKEWVSVKEADGLVKTGLEIVNGVFVKCVEIKVEVGAHFKRILEIVKNIKVKVKRK